MKTSTHVPLFLVAKLAAISSLVLLGTTTRAASVAISGDPQNTTTTIPSDFSGLSYEVSMTLPKQEGARYFSPDNKPLITLFHTLGLKSLRIGGNTSDRNAGALPSEADLDSVFAFARAADVKVIYCLRLHDGDPTQAAATAKYIMAHYGDLMDSFSIGQEPSAYPTEKVDNRPPSERMGAAVEKYPYSSYRDAWSKFAAAIIAAVPNVKFCGPSVHNNGEWARRFIEDFGQGHHVALVTEHLYAGGAAGKLPSAQVGRDRMLSDEFIEKYQKLYDSFVPQAKAAGLPYRLEEVNSYFNGGAQDASNTYAATLWSLDFMFWWAAHNAAGLNFHTGDSVSMNGGLHAPRYAAFVSSPDGFEIRPVAYGLKAFSLASHGRLVPLKIENTEHVNLSAYAVAGTDGSAYVTLINKEHGDSARSAEVSLSLTGSWQHAEALVLKTQTGDVATTTGITLGGAEITKTGEWAGHWASLPSAADGKTLTLTVPAASVTIVRLK